MELHLRVYREIVQHFQGKEGPQFYALSWSLSYAFLLVTVLINCLLLWIMYELHLLDNVELIW